MQTPSSADFFRSDNFFQPQHRGAVFFCAKQNDGRVVRRFIARNSVTSAWCARLLRGAPRRSLGAPVYRVVRSVCLVVRRIIAWCAVFASWCARLLRGAPVYYVVRSFFSDGSSILFNKQAFFRLIINFIQSDRRI